MQKLPFVFPCLLFLSINFLGAQSIEVVLADGTVINGETDYNAFVRTPDKIEVSLDGENFYYTPSQIKGFKTNGDRYVAREIELNTTNQNLQSLTDFKELEWVKKKVFLKTLVQGDVSLFTYKDTRIHYFVSKGEKILELIRLKKSSKATLNHYVGQLNILFSDCERAPKTDYINFNTSSLKKAVIAYNECISGKSIFVEEKNPIEVSLYLVGGYKQTSYDMTGGYYGNYNIDKGDGGSVTYGVAFDLNFLRRTKRLQFYNELLLQNYRFDAFYRSQEQFVEQYVDYFLSMDLSYLEANSMIRYNFGKESNNAKVFLNVGVNLGFQLSDKSTEYSNSVFFGNENRREREPLAGEIKTNRTAILTGIGLRYKLVSFEVRYGFNPKLSGRPAESSTNNLNFLTTFRVF